MSWAFRRQLFYVFVFLLLLGGIGFLASRPFFNKIPSCVDNVQNGTELGVDCGGSCPHLCNTQVDQVSILWARAFKVVAGRYNAVAYLENHNKNAAINRITYRFRFADANNVYIGKREGATFIPPAGKFAIFEPAIDIGNSIPVYTTFEFTETPTWVTVSGEQIDQSKIFVSNIELMDETTSPKLFAVVKNGSLFDTQEVGFIAVLYDNLGNAISGSRTYLETLKGGEKKDINFTWPEPFTSKVVVKEIIPLYNFWLKQ